MNTVERALVFPCAGERLLGVLCTPVAAVATSDFAVLIVIGGPQYRAGSHRQFVQLARALAEAGHACMRFDVRGMGDSTGARRTFETLDEDVRVGIDVLLREAPHARRVALVGLCDGASAALMYAYRQGDARVQALCLLNPWLRSEASLARTHVKHYYWQRATSADFWRKLASGQLGSHAVTDFMRALGSGFLRRRGNDSRSAPVAQQDFHETMLSACTYFSEPMLLALSGNDLTAREFAETTANDARWHRALTRTGVHRFELPKADHTLSQAVHRLAFERQLCKFLREPCQVTAA